MTCFPPIVVQLWYKTHFQKQNPLKIKGLMSGAGGIRIIIGCFPLLSPVRKMRKFNAFPLSCPPPVMPCYPAVVVQLWYKKTVIPLKTKHFERLSMIKYIIAYVPFPDDIHGTVTGMVQFNEQTEQYNILIDSNLPAEEQRFTLKHEFGHIMMCHLTDSDKTMAVRECEADNFADSITDAEFDVLMSLSKEIHQ